MSEFNNNVKSDIVVVSGFFIQDISDNINKLIEQGYMLKDIKPCGLRDSVYHVAYLTKPKK